MSGVKKPWHQGDFATQSRQVRAAAYADPATPCARCGRTLAEHPRTRAGNPPTWSGGHVTDSQTGGPLLPEVLSCNASAGSRLRWARARRAARRTSLTW